MAHNDRCVAACGHDGGRFVGDRFTDTVNDTVQHCRRADHRAERNAERDERARCQRNADAVIEKRPEQIHPDVADNAAMMEIKVMSLCLIMGSFI